MHQDLASLFGDWPTHYGPRDPIVGLARKTPLHLMRVVIEHAALDQESPGTRRLMAGTHSLLHSGARHWLTAAQIPLNVVSL